MKTVYVPKGETVSYENLTTEHLVVDGCLRVSYDLRARSIGGSGIIEAERVFADNIRTDDLRADHVECRRLIVKRAGVLELLVSENAAVSCLLSAEYVNVKRLAVALSNVDEVEADEVVNLTRKKRGLFRFLLASALRSLWLRLTAPKNVIDADYEQAEDDSRSVVDFGAKKNDRPAA